MKHSFRSWGSAIAIAACTILFSAATWIGEVCRSVGRFVISTVHQLVLSIPKTETGVTTASLRGFVVAKAFVLRQVKRERPRVESTWRACPSC